jgi:glycosyltransferase involved in cell wall biosynthesis
MDMFCLSSSSEAFPNVLGEAMASGLPCITTNVGDASYIVGETGVIVPPRNPQALADAIGIISNKAIKDRVAIGKIARQRVEEKFSLASVVENYASLYEAQVRKD